VLDLDLRVQEVRWRPEGEAGPVLRVQAFGEPGRPPMIPRPSSASRGHHDRSDDQERRECGDARLRVVRARRRGLRADRRPGPRRAGGEVPERREPVWLSQLVVDAIHNDQLREHGGLPGLRDENALESALARPQHKWHHDERTDVPMLAAAYAFGLVRNHPYRDGNKRIGFLAMITFLGVNGYDFSATDAEVGGISEDALSDWIRLHSSKRR
jgi:death-on-curing protein